MTLKIFFRNFECPVAFPPSDCSSSQQYLCDSCLTIFTSADFYAVHRSACTTTVGDVLWVDDKHHIFVCELDGRKPSCAPICRRVAKLATFFLDHKMTVDDVHYFGFFCIFERDPSSNQNHFLGYFSKEWDVASAGDSNLACIFVLPPYQGKGYGNLLISLQYLLSAREGRLGTPERPFSWQGARSFDRYWKRVVCAAILDLGKKRLPITTKAICEMTNMLPDDVLVTMRRLKQPKSTRKLRAPLLVFSKEEVQTRSCTQAAVVSEDLFWCSVEEV